MTIFAFTKLIVDDLEGTAAFYASTFGFQQLQRVQADLAGDALDEIVLGTGKTVVLGSAETGEPMLIMLKYLDGRKTPIGEVILGAFTYDFDGFISRALAARGSVRNAPFKAPGAPGRVAVIADPEGHLTELVELTAT